jgi:CheY-like chemotaxis protein
MSQDNDLIDNVLIVDDEEPVRKTFHEWLVGGGLSCRILDAADAEAALVQANHHCIDLAILDWNLGAGNDGLQLLEDLYLFNPNVVAIMITGFAHQATPLDAMRIGVRDYLDKNQNLNRENFLKVVRKQLELIRPAKRERRLQRNLAAFRQAVEKILPLVRSAAALSDPVPLPDAVCSLVRFLLRMTGARDGVLLVRSYDAGRHPPEQCRVYDATGAAMAVDLVPFARSLAGTAVSLQEPCILSRPDESAVPPVELQPFERGRESLLAAPMTVAPGVQAILELFDKQGPEGTSFTEPDRRLVAAAIHFGVDLLRQALAERQTHQVLLDAIAAALGATDSVAASLRGPVAAGPDQPPPTAVLDSLRQGLSAAAAASAAGAAELVQLAEALRMLAARHGPAALRHCIRLVENLRLLLDEVTATKGPEQNERRLR